MAEQERPPGAADGDEDSSSSSEASAEGSLSEQVQEDNRRARRAAAARRRQSRQRELDEARAVGLDAKEMVDEALVRSSDTALKWFLQNFKRIQWVIVGGVAVWGGYTAYGWYMGGKRARASDALAEGPLALKGRVVEADETGGSSLPGDPTRQFASNAEKADAARNAYVTATGLLKGSGVQALALLGQAAILLDEGKYEEARALYEQARQIRVVKETPELSARALEGVALALEGKGDKPGALAQYRELSKLGLAGFSRLARIAEARLLVGDGKIDEAKRLLDEAIASEPPPAKKSPFSQPDYSLQSAVELRQSLLATHPDLSKPGASAGAPGTLDALPEIPPAPPAEAPANP